MYILEFCKPLSVFGKTFRRINPVRGAYIEHIFPLCYMTILQNSFLQTFTSTAMSANVVVPPLSKGFGYGIILGLG